MNIHIDSVPMNQINQSKSLRLIIINFYENLLWKAHIHEIYKKVSSGIGALMQLELSPNPAMILVPDFFLTHLLGTIYRLSLRDKQKANLRNKCFNNLAPANLCNLFAPRTPNYYFRNVRKKIMLPKARTDYLKCSFSYSAALQGWI